MLKKFLLVGMLLCGALYTSAEVVLTASTDKTALTLDDEITLTVQLSGTTGNIVQPQLPSLPAFNVYSRETEQAIINNQATFLFRYTMLPRFVGQAEIGPVTFNYKNKTYKTDPIPVRIYRDSKAVPVKQDGRQAPATKLEIDPNLPPLEADFLRQSYAKAGAPFFLIAAISNPTPYVNESFLLAVRFYYSQAFYDAPYKKPTVSNIFMEEAGHTDGTQKIGGVLYRYNEQRYQLIAPAAGPATIGPASITYQTGRSALSAFDRLFGGAAVSEEQTQTSQPITLLVRDLPPGKPASFHGAVGNNYTLSAQVSPRSVEVGEAINVTVTVKGDGSLKASQDLVLPTMDGFKVYPAASTSGDLPAKEGVPQSYKTFKSVFVPAASGIYTLPSVKWSYFSPQTKQYRTLLTQPVQLTVTPSTKTENVYNFSPNSPSGGGFQTLGSDIHYLKTAYAPAPNILVRCSQYGILNAVALVLVGIMVFFASIGRKSLNRKKAYTQAKTRLKKATKGEDISDALSAYLQQKLKISTGSLPLKDIASALARKGVTPGTVQQFATLWQKLDAARFAPEAWGAQNFLELRPQARLLLKQLEEETK